MDMGKPLSESQNPIDKQLRIAPALRNWPVPEGRGSWKTFSLIYQSKASVTPRVRPITTSASTLGLPYFKLTVAPF